MAKNFLKNIFNQTKNTITKKKTITDSQKLSDIIIINNNESNFFQQKPFDKFNILSDYYPKKELKNKKDSNFLDRINELNNKFNLSQEKFALVKSSLEKLNDDLFSNLIKQIDCYIEEIQRLNKKLFIINNDNKEEIIQKLNKKILENEKTIRNYKHKLRENANKEEKLSNEIEYYKKIIIFYKNKININLISRKISNEDFESKERKEKNNITNLKNYNNITNNIAKPRYSRIKTNYFNQSSGRIIQLRSDKRILSQVDFPNFSVNKNDNIRNRLLTKESKKLEKENQVSEFLSEKDSKDDSNKNLIKIQNKTVNENLDFSNDSSDNINEENEIEDFDINENLNINENMNQLDAKQKNQTNYSKHNKINSEIISIKNLNIKEKDNKLNISNRLLEYKNKGNNYNSNVSDFSIIKRRKSENISLDVQSNLLLNKNNKNNNKSFLEHKNTKSILSFQNPININTSKNTKTKTFNRLNTTYGNLNNQKTEKQKYVQQNQKKTIQGRNTNNDINLNKNEPINNKGKNIFLSKTIERKSSRKENKEDEDNKKNKNNLNKKIKSKSIKKDARVSNNNKKEEKKTEIDEKELKKILKDMNEDYNNDIEMLNNQENQIKFLLNLMDVKN